MLDSSTFRSDTGDLYAQLPWSHGVVIVKIVRKCEFSWQFEAVNIPDWKLSISRAFSLMFTTSDRLLLHSNGGLGCTRLTRRCSIHHSESPGPRPFGLRWCKHPTLSCDLLRQRLREGCLLELAGSDTLAWSEPSERRQGPRSRATGSSSYSKQHRDGCKNITCASICVTQSAAQANSPTC